MVCRWCGADAASNPILKITFCPVHGLESPLDPPGLLLFRCTRTPAADHPPLAGARGSWSVPAG